MASYDGHSFCYKFDFHWPKSPGFLRCKKKLVGCFLVPWVWYACALVCYCAKDSWRAPSVTHELLGSTDSKKTNLCSEIFIIHIHTHNHNGVLMVVFSQAIAEKWQWKLYDIHLLESDDSVVRSVTVIVKVHSRSAGFLDQGQTRHKRWCFFSFFWRKVCLLKVGVAIM